MKIKITLFTISVFTLFTNMAIGQSTNTLKQKDTSNVMEVPLSHDAYDKYILNQFSFALLGNQSPVTGLKFETVKPSITLSGNFYHDKENAVIGNLSVTGGVQNDFADIFSQNHLNGLFAASVGFSVITNNNKSNFPVIDPSYYMTMIKRSQVTELQNKLALQSDTAILVNCLLGNSFLNNPNEQRLFDNYRRQGGSLCKDINSLNDVATTILLAYGLTEQLHNANLMYQLYQQKLLNDSTIQIHKMDFIAKQASLAKIAKSKQDSVYNTEINYFKNQYSVIHIAWWTFSAFTSNASFQLLNNIKDTTLTSKNSILFGFKPSWNYLIKHKETSRFLYVTIGGTISKVNSLDDQAKFNYKSSTQIKVNKTETLTDEKTGTGYQGDFKAGFGFGAFSTFYWMPWEKITILGIYSKLEYINSDVYASHQKLAFDFGTIWNINNSAKDSKNILSIIPFVRWSNLFKQYSDVAKTKPIPLHDLFSVGIQVGIPINIGR